MFSCYLDDHLSLFWFFSVFLRLKQSLKWGHVSPLHRHDMNCRNSVHCSPSRHGNSLPHGPGVLWPARQCRAPETRKGKSRCSLEQGVCDPVTLQDDDAQDLLTDIKVEHVSVCLTNMKQQVNVGSHTYRERAPLRPTKQRSKRKCVWQF